MNASNEDSALVSSEQLLERSSSWTLACDNLLLNKLKAFSKELEDKSAQLSADCTELGRETGVLEAKLGNVTNEFLSLSSTQFVENRVQEFEEGVVSGSGGTSPRPISLGAAKKSKGEREAELIAKMKEAIQIGISISSKHAESQEPSSSSTLSLPYLIGSPKYFSNRYVGLVDDHARLPVSKSLLVINVPETDKTEVEHSSMPNHSKVKRTESTNSIQTNPNIPISATNLPPELNPQSRTLDSSLENANSNSKPQQINKPAVMNPPTIERTKSNNATLYAKKEERYFDDGPPPPSVDSDDSEDDFRPITRPGGLFADDDDDDIFNDSSLFVANKVDNSFFPTTSSIIDKQIANARMASPPPLEDPNLQKNIMPSNIKGQSDFDFGKEPKRNDIIKQADADPKSVRETDDVNHKNVQSNSKSGSKFKIPPGGVAVFGNIPSRGIQHNIESKSVVKEEPETQLPGNASKCVTVSERGSSVGTNEDQDNTSHSSLNSKGLTSSQGSLNEPVAPQNYRTKQRGIFNDDSDEDIFLSKKPTQITTAKDNTSSLFKDSLSVDRATNSAKKSSLHSTKKLKRSIFDDSDSDDDLFSSASSTSSKTNQTKPKPNLVLPIKKETEVLFGKKRASGLFEEEDDDSDLFANDPNDHISKLNVTKDKITKKAQNLNNNGDKQDGIIQKAVDQAKVLATHSNIITKKKLDYQNQEKMNSDEGLLDQQSSEETVQVSTTTTASANLDLSNLQSSQQPTVQGISEFETESSGENVEVGDKMKHPDSTPNQEEDQNSVRKDVIDNKTILTDELVAEDKIKSLKKKLSSTESSNNKNSLDEPLKAVGKQDKISKLKEKLSLEKDGESKPVHVEEPKSTSTLKDSKISKLKEKLATPPDSKAPKQSQESLASKLSRPKIDIKKLGLNINPLAMMPGAKLPKQGSEEKPESPVSEGKPGTPQTPDSPKASVAGTPSDSGQEVTEEVYPPKIPSVEDLSQPGYDQIKSSPQSSVEENPMPILPVEDTSSSAQTIENDNNVSSPLLNNILKGRPRILSKRKPPSKHLLHSYRKIVVDPLESSEFDKGEDVESLSSEAETSKLNDNQVFASESVKTPTSLAQENNKPMENVEIEKSDILNDELVPILVEENLENVKEHATEESSPNLEKVSIFADENNDNISSKEELNEKKNLIRPLSSILWDESDEEPLPDVPKTKIVEASSSSKEPSSKDELFGNEQSHTSTGIESEIKIEENLSQDIASIKTTSENVPKSEKPKKEEIKSSKQVDKNQKSVFGEESSDSSDADIFKTPAPKKKESTEPLIAEAPIKKERSISPTSQTASTSSNVQLPQKQTQKDLLFASDSDSDSDIFKSSKATVKTKPTKAKSKVPEVVKPHNATKQVKQNKPKPSTKSIFEDSSDDDLFASKSKKKTAP